MTSPRLYFFVKRSKAGSENWFTERLPDFAEISSEEILWAFSLPFLVFALVKSFAISTLFAGLGFSFKIQVRTSQQLLNWPSL